MTPHSLIQNSPRMNESQPTFRLYLSSLFLRLPLPAPRPTCSGNRLIWLPFADRRPALAVFAIMEEPCLTLVFLQELSHVGPPSRPVPDCPLPSRMHLPLPKVLPCTPNCDTCSATNEQTIARRKAGWGDC